MASIVYVVAWYAVVCVIAASILYFSYRMYGDSPAHRRNVAQVIGGIIIIVVLYRASLFALHKDSLVDTSRDVDARRPTRTEIVDGYTEVPLLVDRVFETLDPRAPSYMALPRSVNRRGGAQFSYQYWLYLGDVSGVANQTILLRGDPRVYHWNSRADQTPMSGVAIVCPSIAFGDSYDSIRVRFNTSLEIGSMYDSATALASGDSSRQNLLKMTVQKWTLFTIVFEDNEPVSDFENGIRLRIYVNDFLYDSAVYPGATLKQNNAQLCLFPTIDGVPGGLKGARIGDLSYYNYAVGIDKVKHRFDAGPPKGHATDKATSSDLGQPLYLSEYNRLDMLTS